MAWAEGRRPVARVDGVGWSGVEWSGVRWRFVFTALKVGVFRRASLPFLCVRASLALPWAKHVRPPNCTPSITYPNDRTEPKPTWLVACFLSFLSFPFYLQSLRGLSADFSDSAGSRPLPFLPHPFLFLSSHLTRRSGMKMKMRDEVRVPALA